MIATLSAVLYIVSETQEITANKILQKGQAISKINDDSYQIYHYTLFAPAPHADNPEIDSETLEIFELQAVYLVHGKFGYHGDGTLDLSVTSNRRLPVAPHDMPVSNIFVHLLGRVENNPIRSEDGYQVALQVKPYLSKDQCGPVSITLLHSADGRLKNAIERTRKFSLVHTMGALVIHEKKLYCEILEYQFVSTKSDDNNNVVVPWKKGTVDKSESSTKSAIQKRVAAVHQNIQQSPPEPIEHETIKRKGKQTQSRIVDIAANLVSKNCKSEDSRSVDEELEVEATNSADVEDSATPVNAEDSEEDVEVFQKAGQKRRRMPKRQHKNKAK